MDQATLSGEADRQAVSSDLACLEDGRLQTVYPYIRQGHVFEKEIHHEYRGKCCAVKRFQW